MYGWNRALFPSFFPSFHRFLLTFSTSADQFIKRRRSLAPSRKRYIYQVICFCDNVSYSWISSARSTAYVFSFKSSPAVKLSQCCSMEVAPCMIDLKVTPGHKSHLSLHTIIRERLQGSSSSI